MLRISKGLGPIATIVAFSLILSLVVPAAAAGGDALVSVGSPPAPFSQNKQNEPALAVDASHPNILAAGSNDEIDLEGRVGGEQDHPTAGGVIDQDEADEALRRTPEEIDRAVA